MGIIIITCESTIHAIKVSGFDLLSNGWSPYVNILQEPCRQACSKFWHIVQENLSYCFKNLANCKREVATIMQDLQESCKSTLTRLLACFAAMQDYDQYSILHVGLLQESCKSCMISTKESYITTHSCYGNQFLHPPTVIWPLMPHNHSCYKIKTHNNIVNV